MKTVKDAIKEAADFVEAHADRYDYMQGSVPGTTRGCGCMLAWVGYFLGMPRGTTFLTVAARIGVPALQASVMVAAGAPYDGINAHHDPKTVAAWMRRGMR